MLDNNGVIDKNHTKRSEEQAAIALGGDAGVKARLKFCGWSGSIAGGAIGFLF